MVRLNSSIQLRDSSDHERLHDLLTRLCETSLREKGTDDRHIVSATFADRHAFESHAAATRELKDEVERIATLTYETFDF